MSTPPRDAAHPSSASDRAPRTELVSTSPPDGGGSTRGADVAAPVGGFARFELLGELGRGGMGVVHRAYDPAIRREVALKVLLAPDPGSETLARFVQEAQITGQLEHTGVPPVYELGRTTDGAPYFAMKLVRGTSLRSHLEAMRNGTQARGSSSRTFELDRRLDVLEKVGETLAFAHSRGVIHRDLKPDNVMVGEFGEVQLMDWGLAKVVADRDEPMAPQDRELRRPVTSEAARLGPGLTHEGAVAGTPAYMAPEQARGDVTALDERTDVFALGALLYELLTLSPPYRGGTAFDVVVRAAEGTWTPIDARLAEDGNPRPRPPRELVAIAHRALAVAPEARYSSVLSLLADLRAYRTHEPVAAYRDPIASRVIKGVRRHPRATLLLACVAALAAIGSQVRAAFRSAEYRTELAEERASREAAEANLARAAAARSAQDAASLAVLATNELSDEHREAIADFRRHQQAGIAAGDPDEQILQDLKPAQLERYLLAFDGLVRVHAVRGSQASTQVHCDRALLEQRAGKLPEALADFDRAVEIDPRNIDALCKRGSARQANGDAAGALADFNRALELDSRCASALSNRGKLRYNQGAYAEAFADFDRAVAVRPGAPHLLSNRGVARQRLGDVAGALADFDQALALRPGAADYLANRAAARLEHGDLEGAIADCDLAIARAPLRHRARLTRALVWHARRDVERAIAELTETIEIAPRDSEAWFHRGHARHEHGDLIGALADYDRALELDPRAVDAWVNRGLVRHLQGDLARALVDFDHAIELAPGHANAWFNRGCVRRTQDDVDGALADFDRAIALDPRHAEAFSNRGSARRAKGDLDGAVADYDQALALDSTVWQAAANRGLALELRGRHAEALASLQRAYRACPDAAARTQLEALIRQRGGTPSR